MGSVECVDRELFKQACLLWELHKDEFKPKFANSISLLEWCIRNWIPYGVRIYKGWDWEKNEIDIWNIGSGSEKKVYLNCKEEHSFNVKCGYLTGKKKSWCPYCNGHRVLKGYNDLETWCKNDKSGIGDRILTGWIYEKNTETSIDNVAPKSHKKAWFRCTQGHEWQNTVCRITNSHWCPYCSNQRVLKGYNDLESWCKDDKSGIGKAILNGWSDENDFKPCDVMVNTNKKIWFQCKRGHKWNTYISVIKKGCWCPYCSQRNTSFPEQVIYFWCKENFKEVLNRHKFNGDEVDVFIKDIGLCIEYQGERWHKDRWDKDYEKYLRLTKSGYDVVWVSDGRIDNYEDIIKFIHDYKNDGQCKYLISKLSDYISQKYSLKLNPDVNTEILSNAWFYAKNVPDENILENWCKSHAGSERIIESWDYDLNAKNGMYIDKIPYNTSARAYFKCSKCNKILYKRIYDVVIEKHWCPYCSGKKVLKGYNDLESGCEKNGIEEILKDWNYDKNEGLLPSDYHYGTKKDTWWKCSKCGYEWKARIDNRKAGYGKCPKCRKEKKNEEKGCGS